MPRQITLEEAALVIQLEHRLSALLRGDQTSRQPYEATLDQLVKLARPALLCTARPTIPETPPASPLSPDATGAAASTIPPQAGGGLITEEGLRDALVAAHRELEQGTLQFNWADWPSALTDYILRHCDRQTETREAAE